MHVGIREWYQADIRYDEGGYYVTTNNAIASAKFSNRGHAPAKNIIILSSFPEILTDISLSNSSVNHTILSGGVGKNDVKIKIERLVQGQEVFLYFAIAHPTSSGSDKLSNGFLKEINFDGGKGKTGQPLWSFFLSILIAIPISLIFSYGSNKIVPTLFEKQFKGHYEKLQEILKLSYDSIEKGVSIEEFQSLVENKIENVNFRKKTLREVALRTFELFKK